MMTVFFIIRTPNLDHRLGTQLDWPVLMVLLRGLSLTSLILSSGSEPLFIFDEPFLVRLSSLPILSTLRKV